MSAFDGQAKPNCGSALTAVVAVAAMAMAVAVLLAGCGGGDSGGGTKTTADEKTADVELLNAAIGQELATIDAYEFGLRLLHGKSAAAARQMRGQAQEHVDGMTKAIRGLGGEVEAEADEVDLSEVKKDETGFLTFAYELEAAAVAAYNDTVVGLQTSAPRRVSASIAANKVQHLVILRQLLGASLLESFPEAFDGGQVPPPGSPPEDGG